MNATLFGWGIAACAVSGVTVLAFMIAAWLTGTGRWPRH